MWLARRTVSNSRTHELHVIPATLEDILNGIPHGHDCTADDCPCEPNVFPYTAADGQLWVRIEHQNKNLSSEEPS